MLIMRDAQMAALSEVSLLSFKERADASNPAPEIFLTSYTRRISFDRSPRCDRH